MKPPMEHAIKMLEDVHPDEHFVTQEGKKISNVQQLHAEVDEMPDYVFAHHVNADRNDFANWVHHSVNDPFLAKMILREQTKQEIANIVRGRVFQLKKHIKSQWLKKQLQKWEIMDFALGILVGVGVAVIIALS